jgi:hypothetical protein
MLSTLPWGAVHLCNSYEHLSPFRSRIDRYSLPSINWQTPVGGSKPTHEGNYHGYRNFNLLGDTGCWRMAAKTK